MLVLLRIVNILLLVMLVAGLVALALYPVLRQPRRKQKGAAIADDSGVRRMLAEGRFEEAVMVYQAFTNTDAFTAEAEVRAIAHQMGLDMPPVGGNSPPDAVTDQPTNDNMQETPS